MTTRIALGIEYNGAAFYGWQRQLSPALPTVQATVERALARIAAHEVALSCAGRTDAGVHAASQVVHFDANIDRGAKAWVMGTNTHLPAEVRVQWATPVADDFHARHSARSRRYRYILYDEPVKPTVLVNQLTHVRSRLDSEAMHAAAQHLVGEHDFSAFCGNPKMKKSTVRFIRSIELRRCGEELRIYYTGNGFLQNMVRILTGTLIEVGRGERSADSIPALFGGKRAEAGFLAPAQGLCLQEVYY